MILFHNVLRLFTQIKKIKCLSFATHIVKPRSIK
nr:MAG TPA: hypothetical protein [Caudoviricetes sp.]